MKTSTVVWILVAVIIVLGAGWYFFLAGSMTPAPSTALGTNGSPNQGNLGQPDNGQPQQPLADGAEGSVIGNNLALGTESTATLGQYLIAYNGMTLYTFAKDSAGTSTCYGSCATSWPPYIVGPEDNLTNLQTGVTGSVSTITRADGKLQATYNGMPLYFYAGDQAAGDTTGQGVGKVWYVVKP